ncbi:MAG TPA: hypothetical protein PLO49_07905 [Methanofastidiosum sp.]|nr:hypothetical protein [Methanofastidiosum sp.]HQF90351.1 hypothetical protein [Methanofastidiosum sp.]
MLNKILSIFLFSCLIFSIGCVSNTLDSCNNVQCPDECHGNALWIQVCQNSKCMPYREIEKCSARCGCCPDQCLGENLYSYKSQNEECIRDKILERYSYECGSTKIKTNLLYSYDVWTYYTYYETDPSQKEYTEIGESFYIQKDQPVYIGLKLKAGNGPLSNSLMSNNSGLIYWAKSFGVNLTKEQFSLVEDKKKLIEVENLSNDVYFEENLVYLDEGVYFDARGFNYLFRWKAPESGAMYLWHPVQYEMYVMN